ncbi:hypothetical protein FKM82_009415 [Ascaphus truei]
MGLRYRKDVQCLEIVTQPPSSPPTARAFPPSSSSLPLLPPPSSPRGNLSRPFAVCFSPCASDWKLVKETYSVDIPEEERSRISA